ncbi:MAG TPA: hypothetical protein VFW40_03905 [Capsulimonadaceae bacterium]|nr:hypothetical protein [Capsulimonadaceae bacterium]
MPSPFVVSPVCLLVAAASCLAMYAGARLTASLRTSRLITACLLEIALAGALLAFHPGNLLLSDLLVTGLGLLGGALIGRQIVSGKVLALALACAAGADCASFFFGPTHFAMHQAAGTGMHPVMEYLSISVPIANHLYSVIGLGDLWIFTACVTSTRRLGWPEQMTLLAPLAGILLAVIAGLTFGALPALPFLAGTVLLYHAMPRRQALAEPTGAR